MKKVIIFGATSTIGLKLIEALNDYEIYCVSRDKYKYPRSALNSVQYDLENDEWQFPITKFDFCVFCAESSLISSLPSILEIDHMIFVSSASKVLKGNLKNKNDIALVEELSKAETFVENNYNSYSIVRPTWVFDGYSDKITNTYVQLARRFKVFPFVYNSHGKRNPIDPKTISRVLCAIIKDKRLQANEAFNIGGCKTCSYKMIVNKILTSHRIYFIPLFMPLFFYKLGLRVMHKFNKFTSIHEYMFEHMKEDLNIDNTLLPEPLQKVIRVNSTKFWESYDKT